MSTPTQRSFVYRHRFHILWTYLLLLLFSHLSEWRRTPDLHPYSPPEAHVEVDPPPVWIFVDPLDTAGVELERYAMDRAGKGNPAWMVALPGLTHSGNKEHSFEQLSDMLPDSATPSVLIANGHAGAVAIHYAATRPDQVAGLILVNATGVQELSLLGEYHLNYALYAVSEFALGAFHRFVPHFGLWPRLRLQKEQIHLLRHSDRRKLRPLFESIQSPVLILHPPQETMRYSAAKEHERLIPQSLSVTLEENMPLATFLDPFLEALQSGEMPERAKADPERLAAAEARFDAGDRPRPEAGMLWLLLIAIACATLITEDLTCALTGLMIANGNLTWTEGVGACLAGILIGDYLLYLTGRFIGRPALNRIPLRWMIDPVTLRETEEWFDRRVGSAIFVSRFVPGARMPAFMAAGLLGVPAKSFTPYYLAAALLWTPTIVTLSVYLSEVALDWIARFHHTAPALIIAALIFYWFFVHVFLPAFSWRGRRKLAGKWRRRFRPEYWSPKLLYLPVTVYLLVRSLRKGNHLFDFTACNPCMPASGVAGESKSDILDRFRSRDALAAYILLPAHAPLEEKLAMARQFLLDNNLQYPLVLKPDAGERGSGVFFCETETELRQALPQTREAYLLQAGQTGKEFGVFYIREPGEDEGRIFAVTRKTFPVITGDGQRNLEDLILADERAVCQARVHFEHLQNRLYEIPEAGEEILLSRIGNHARGTLFEDGMSLVTPALNARIDEISKSLPGFYFGRYDLFAPSDQAFSEGRDLKIIELNGVTSEATSLYAPGTSYPAMVKVLLRQWAIACRIGRTLREQGTPVLSFKTFLRNVDQHFKRNAERKLGRMTDGNS
ncbi:MAG: VTT domain-containing protein [Verrucomicrobia bacterium]|nr:VTT domain-containing protein [Verrucomicrobiota bacterium]MCH8510646.1 VTT domain-containing protein [Kiritimatiellia bacterium]